MSCATTARTVSVWLSVVHWLQALRAWRQRCGQLLYMLGRGCQLFLPVATSCILYF